MVTRLRDEFAPCLTAREYLIVAVTGYGEERDRERSAQAGFDAHLVKPVDPDQLLAVLRGTSRRTVTLDGVQSAQDAGVREPAALDR